MNTYKIHLPEMLYVDLMPILLYFHISPTKRASFSHNPHYKKANISHFPNSFPQITERQLYHHVKLTLKANPEITLHFLANCISLLNKLSDEKTDSEHNYNKQNFKQYMSVALSCFFH